MIAEQDLVLVVIHILQEPFMLLLKAKVANLDGLLLQAPDDVEVHVKLALGTEHANRLLVMQEPDRTASVYVSDDDHVVLYVRTGLNVTKKQATFALMNLMIIYGLGFLLVLLAAIINEFQIKLRLSLCGLGGAICLFVMFIPTEQRAVQKVSFRYPCDLFQDKQSISTLASQIKNLNIEADSIAMHDEPFFAHCGDEPTSYLLRETTSNGWFYSPGTINVIANNPIEQYEKQLNK